MFRKTILVVLVLGFAGMARATIVDIRVATDKSTYQLGEYVTISVTAYNPNPEPVTLTFTGRLATYIIDDAFDLADWPFFPQITYETIQQNASFTWNLTHDYWPTQEYPLDIGTHIVVGQFWADELGEDNTTLPVEFEVVPEPITCIFFAVGLPVVRFFSRRKS